MEPKAKKYLDAMNREMESVTNTTRACAFLKLKSGSYIGIQYRPIDLPKIGEKDGLAVYLADC